VLKRWAARPPGIRWLVGIAAVVLTLAIVWALFVPVADWLAYHDVGSVKGSLHETAVDNARGRLLTLGAGLLAAGALVFTAWNVILYRRSNEVTEQGQVTDRYTKAIDQLGSDKLDVRIGGIYALERIARDSPRDHPTVMEVLAAFVREHSREQWPPLPDEPGADMPERATRPDVQAAIKVIGRRDSNRDREAVDLGGANLTRAYVAGTNLAGARLVSANLTDAYLGGAYLKDADLNGAVLNGTRFNGAHLNGAFLNYAGLKGADFTGGADLTGAYLIGAHLTGARFGGSEFTHNDTHLNGACLNFAELNDADLTGADLTDAYLVAAHLDNANLTDARFNGAHLTNARFNGAYLHGTDLTGADLNGVDLTGADLTDATWPADTPVPEGWKLAIGSSRLTLAGTDSEPTQAN